MQGSREGTGSRLFTDNSFWATLCEAKLFKLCGLITKFFAMWPESAMKGKMQTADSNTVMGHCTDPVDPALSRTPTMKKSGIGKEVHMCPAKLFPSLRHHTFSCVCALSSGTTVSLNQLGRHRSALILMGQHSQVDSIHEKSLVSPAT